ncbi:MAG: ABC transporter permease [Bacteroidales bacterium]|nr:ABC transporter permease [Bacteroidales bacterium]MCI2136182.1 ABC transporter permease [Bacteroidales bacterium]
MKTYKRSAWAMPYFIFLVVFVALPLLMVLIYAFQDQASGKFTFDNFAKFFQRGEDLRTFLYSIEIALINTLICLLLGYPAAWIMANSKLNKSSITIMLFILPMWINMLIRTLATVALFDFAKVPLAQGALIFGMVYNFLPFMIYPIYNQLNKMDKAYSEAATDLGASPTQVFTKVTIPLSMPGVWSGVLMVFMPTISTFAIAELLTLNKVKLFGTTIQENINNGMWNYGSGLALIMLVIIGISVLLSNDDSKRDDEKGGMI